MSELSDFGLVVLVVATGVMLALLAARLSERYPVPAPALFLLAALALPVALPHIRTVERIGVVAVVLILFDGGMNIGWRRFRRAVVPIATLGIVGTLTTAVLTADLRPFPARLQLDTVRSARRRARPDRPGRHVLDPR